MIEEDPVASTGQTLPTNDQSTDEATYTDDELSVSIPAPTPNDPHLYTREDSLNYKVALHQAGLNGDWETANKIFMVDPYWISAPITSRYDTILHIVTEAQHLHFVRKLVERMDWGTLGVKNHMGDTALCIAAVSGNVHMAKLMVDLNGTLANIRDNRNLTPLHMAILVRQREMVMYLLNFTNDEWLDDEDRIELVTDAVHANLYDVALFFMRKHPHLALLRNSRSETVLHALARSHFSSPTCEPRLWKKFLRRCKNICKEEPDQQQLEIALQVTRTAWDEVLRKDENVIKEIIESPWPLLFTAVEVGNLAFLQTLLHSYPDLLWKVNEDNRSIFHIAVENRHEHIFKHLQEFQGIKYMISYRLSDEQKVDMLRLTAKIASPDRLNRSFGAALQMQQELLWFEAVKNLVSPHLAMAKVISKEAPHEFEENHNVGITPHALFTQEHTGLRLQGEEWMKKTAESCTLVAALITTVVFTAAFTLPGGNDDKEGSPILLKQPFFKLFVISNAVSFLASVISILMFLSILISRYAEQDFLMSLPLKLMVGLAYLFFSISNMMVAFTATFLITFQKDSTWIAEPIALLAVIPVSLFGFQQYPLLVEIHRSTYQSSTLFQPSKKQKLHWERKSS